MLDLRLRGCVCCAATGSAGACMGVGVSLPGWMEITAMCCVGASQWVRPRPRVLRTQGFNLCRFSFSEGWRSCQDRGITV